MNAPLSASTLNALRFAKFPIVNQIFFQSALSIGIVNLKPIVPGHLLVIPKRIVPRFGEMTADEVTDLYQAVHQISKVVEREYKAMSLTIAMQDGAYAGQSVPHVHVHILPRRKGDFEPIDEVYTALDSANIAKDYSDREKRIDRKAFVDDESRKPRTKAEMEEEARRLAALFPPHNQGLFVDTDTEQ